MVQLLNVSNRVTLLIIIREQKSYFCYLNYVIWLEIESERNEIRY